MQVKRAADADPGEWIYWLGKPASVADPAAIELLLEADADLGERAAIREFDGGMSRQDAARAALQDLLDDIERIVAKPRASGGIANQRHRERQENGRRAAQEELNAIWQIDGVSLTLDQGCSDWYCVVLYLWFPDDAAISTPLQDRFGARWDSSHPGWRVVLHGDRLPELRHFLADAIRTTTNHSHGEQR